MATLSGTRIKNTYQGLLKTSDAAALTGSLKVVQDGSGNDSALSLSTAAVKAESLQLESVTSGSSSTKVLVWDSSTKDVEYRTLPVFESVTTTVGGTSAPTITIADAAGTSKTVTFSAGGGIGLSRSGDTITISSGDANVINLTTGSTAMSSSNATYTVDLANLSTVALPTPAAGAQITMILTSTNSSEVTFNVKVPASQTIIGKVTLTSTTADKTDTQISSADTATSFILDGNATNKGGQVGDRIELFGVSSTQWLMTALLTTSNAAPSNPSVINEP